MNINSRWAERFIKADVRECRQDAAYRAELVKRHEGSRGRKLLRLSSADLRALPEQLHAAGFKLVDGHCLAPPQGSERLVLSFQKAGDAIVFPWPLLQEFLGGTFEHVHVWVNPPVDGVALNCVTAAQRGENKPRFQLIADPIRGWMGRNI